MFTAKGLMTAEVVYINIKRCPKLDRLALIPFIRVSTDGQGQIPIC
jgi:hypothetical protein